MDHFCRLGGREILVDPVAISGIEDSRKAAKAVIFEEFGQLDSKRSESSGTGLLRYQAYRSMSQQRGSTPPTPAKTLATARPFNRVYSSRRCGDCTILPKLFLTRA